MKKFKSWVVLVFSLVLMMMFLAACGNKAPEGTYRKSVDGGSLSFVISNNKVEMQIKADGASGLVGLLSGDTSESKSYSGTVDAKKETFDFGEDQVINYKLKGDKLAVTLDGTTYNLSKE